MCTGVCAHRRRDAAGAGSGLGHPNLAANGPLTDTGHFAWAGYGRPSAASSDEEGDEEDQSPAKRPRFVPAWAQPENLAQALVHQEKNSPRTIFGAYRPPDMKGALAAPRGREAAGARLARVLT